MRQLLPERLLSGFLSLSLHLAAGLALLSAWKDGMPPRNIAGNHDGKAMIVEFISLDREDIAGDREAPRNMEAIEPASPADTPAGIAGKESPQPSTPAAAGAEPKMAHPAVDAQDGTRQMADLPGAEVLAYRQRLESHLARYRIYPASARAQGREGVVMLHFEMTHEGKVLNAWVSESSGIAEIDREAVEAVLRAQPLPPFPNSWPGELDILLPVTFRLG